MTNSEHQEHLEYIASMPFQTTGIENIIQVRLEVPIYKVNYNKSDLDYDSPTHRGKLIAQADFIFTHSNGLHSMAEYKANDTRLARFKAQDQLLIGSMGIKEMPINIHIDHMYYIFGKKDLYHVEELIEHDGHMEWSTRQ